MLTRKNERIKSRKWWIDKLEEEEDEHGENREVGMGTDMVGTKMEACGLKLKGDR